MTTNGASDMTGKRTEELGYQDVNRACWDLLASNSNPLFQPASTEVARSILDPHKWIPWGDIRSILCLAAGGGLQAPLFSSLGYDVTVADLSSGQLDCDRQIAAHYGLEIEFVEADMLDLRSLHGRGYDLVYQGISSCYVPDVRRLYKEVAAVGRRGGLYLVEHWAPHHLQLDPLYRWDGMAYRLHRSVRDRSPIEWSAPEPIAGQTAKCWHYVHSLEDLIGGLCDTGFVITAFRETEKGDPEAAPDSDEHLAAWVPPLIRLFSQLVNP